MPNSIFSCQTTLIKAKFLKFGIKMQPGNPGLFDYIKNYLITTI